MIVFIIGDIHMSPEKIARIPEIENADLIVINGDLTNYGSKEDCKTVLNHIMSINPQVLAQFGNLDKPEINNYLQDLDINLHGQARMFHNRVCFMGVGGSNLTPFATPSEFTEQELESLLTAGYDQAQTFIKLAEPIEKIKIPLILISHAPPLNTRVDKLANGSHAGSSAVRNFIEKYQPDLCVCGHIHEAAGSDHIGETPIFNPGMLSKGGWIKTVIDKSTVSAQLHD